MNSRTLTLLAAACSPSWCRASIEFTLVAGNAAAPLGSEWEASDSDTVTLVAVAYPEITKFEVFPLGDNEVELSWKLGGGQATKLTASYQKAG